jgi:hypothetical protein
MPEQSRKQPAQIGCARFFGQDRRPDLCLSKLPGDFRWPQAARPQPATWVAPGDRSYSDSIQVWGAHRSKRNCLWRVDFIGQPCRECSAPPRPIDQTASRAAHAAWGRRWSSAGRCRRKLWLQRVPTANRTRRPRRISTRVHTNRPARETSVALL